MTRYPKPKNNLCPYCASKGYSAVLNPVSLSNAMTVETCPAMTARDVPHRVPVTWFTHDASVTWMEVSPGAAFTERA